MLRSLLLIRFRMAIGFLLPVTQPRVFWAIICQLLGILTLLFMQFQSFWTMAVLRNSEPLFCVNPLTVAEGKKLRLVIDLRHVNCRLVRLSLSTRSFALCHRFFKKGTGSLPGTSNLDTSMLIVFWAWFGIFWAWFGMFWAWIGILWALFDVLLVKVVSSRVFCFYICIFCWYWSLAK